MNEVVQKKIVLKKKKYLDNKFFFLFECDTNEMLIYANLFEHYFVFLFCASIKKINSTFI